MSCPNRNLAVFHHYRHYEGLRLLPSVCDSKLIQQTLFSAKLHIFPEIIAWNSKIITKTNHFLCFLVQLKQLNAKLADITPFHKWKTTIPKWNCGNDDKREKYIPRHPHLNEYQESDYLSGVKVDLPPKKPFKRARRAMKKRTVKSKSSIVSFVLSWTSVSTCKDSDF